MPILSLLICSCVLTLLQPVPEQSVRSADAVVLEMLQNIKDNGLNNNPALNNGLGGLWINWRYGAKPLQTNFNGTGAPDRPDAPLRHDVLTDLRYLHNLLLYKKAHTADPQFDADISRFSKIVKLEFASARNERGWLYDELIDMHRISGDGFYRQLAHDLAGNFATVFYRDPPGIYYKTNANHPRGYYRVDLVLEIGCALIQAAREFDQPAWEQKGRRMVDYVYDHAYIHKYCAFPSEMDEVLLPGGAVNPNQTIYRDSSGRYKREGGSVRMGGVGQIITSLLHAHAATGDKLFLERATEMLDALSPERNLLGLWDAANLGYHASAVFSGPDFRDPGKPRLNSGKKESGRQLHLLEAACVANHLTAGRYRRLEESLLQVALEKAYYAAGHGLVYEQATDWRLLPLKGGGSADWVTAEAMGIALESLQQCGRKDPW